MLQEEEIIKYYSRRDIQKAIIEVAADREVAVKYGDQGFGKRPDILQFEGDVLELAKQGATSFHLSEERWRNPLDLVTGMTKKQLDNLRIGWDLILDIDCKFLEYSKITASLICEALKFNEVKNYSLKFSGGTGFHIAVPYESFPKKVHNLDTKLLFPDGPRVIASYIRHILESHLAEQILKINTLKEISTSTKKPIEELTIDGKFNPYSVLEIDTILISSRHMFRAPYSINEKTGLVSVPIDIKDIKNFNLKIVKPSNVEIQHEFLKRPKENIGDAATLIIQSFDWAQKAKKEEKLEITTPRKTEVLTVAIQKEELFPPCINKGLQGLIDGKKRFLFILINFLKNLGWSMDDIEKRVLEWNKLNPEPLRENYIISQLNWHRHQKQAILPPNCASKAYYKELSICNPAPLCNKIKNPVNYTLIRSKSK